MIEERRSRYQAFHALIALAIMGGIAPATAQMPGYNGNNRSQRVWNQMDVCKRAAWKAHPDYTREDAAKRDAALRHCLEARHLPPATPTAPAPVPPPESAGASR